MLRGRNSATRFVLAALVIFLIIQFVPYGRNHINPPIIRKTAWESPYAASLAKWACYDCHSHQTNWPWYSWVAPVSWLVQHDVDAGRRKLNFSDWNGFRKGESIDKIRKEMSEGEMPPLPYRWVHPQARLSDVEKKALCDGLKISQAIPQER